MKTVELPGSKSIVARLAVIAAIGGGEMPDGGESDDAEIIVKALTTEEERVYVGSSGTAARFAIAFYGSREGRRVIECSEQMRRRPVGTIVEAMRSLGAKIEYRGAEGFLPVAIEGCEMLGNEVEVDARESSQSVSALMLVGITRGLKIHLKGDVVSRTYIDLTCDVMTKCGAKIKSEGNEIEVAKGEYKTMSEVERDWSSAVFWYGRVAVGDEEELLLKNLNMKSLQPDRRAVEYFEKLGVRSQQLAEGVKICRAGDVDSEVKGDCKGCPDLVPLLVAAMCRRNVRFRLSGLEVLQRKESRRGEVMVREMRKLGYMLQFDGEQMWWNGEKREPKGMADVADDHRIAMALLVAGAKIENIKCIEKSYRKLWNDQLTRE